VPSICLQWRDSGIAAGESSVAAHVAKAHLFVASLA
jgi:hypothetical protein